MDHTVRLWNPYVPSKPVAQLTVHTTSILDIVIAKEMGLIFSYSQDSVCFYNVSYIHVVRRGSYNINYYFNSESVKFSHFSMHNVIDFIVCYIP